MKGGRDSGAQRYYSYGELLSKKDLDGEKPAIYFVCTNRSAGKTTGALQLALERCRKNERFMFGLVYRYGYELGASGMLFNDVIGIYKSFIDVTSKPMAKGLFYELRGTWLDGDSPEPQERVIGYAFSLGNAENLKKYSPLFAGVDMLIFDEFESDRGKYLKNETDALASLMLTISRGGGSQSRTVELFMLGNNISMLNPYFVKLDIYKRLREDTRFIRGHGWIMEYSINRSAQDAIRNNRAAQAFAQMSGHIEQAISNDEAYESGTFIQKMKGQSRYLATLVIGGICYGVKTYDREGIIYITRDYDSKYPAVYTFRDADHTQNTYLVKQNSWIFKQLETAYICGYMRFDSMQAKDAIYHILAIQMFE